MRARAAPRRQRRSPRRSDEMVDQSIEPVETPTGRSRMGRRWWIVGVAIAALIVVVLVPLASSDPDGLERVAQDHGFLGQARAALYSIIPDYTIPGIGGEVATVLAGLLGVAGVFGLLGLVGRWLPRSPGGGAVPRARPLPAPR